MRTLLMILAVMAGMVLVGCGQPDFAPERVPVPVNRAVETGLYPGQDAALVASTLRPDHIPAEYAGVELPGGDMNAQYALSSWSSFQYHAEHHSLGEYRPANVTELLAFAANYRTEPNVVGLRGICAPMGIVQGGGSMVAVLSVSDGFRFGWWQKHHRGCKHALLVHAGGLVTVKGASVSAPSTE